MSFSIISQSVISLKLDFDHFSISCSHQCCEVIQMLLFKYIVPNVTSSQPLAISVSSPTRLKLDRIRDLPILTAWFSLTTVLSITGTVLLLLLLLSTIHQRKHCTGAHLLIVHLMLLQLLLIGFTFPVLNTQTYFAVVDRLSSMGNATAIAPRRPPIHCPTLMFIHLSLMYTEN